MKPTRTFVASIAIAGGLAYSVGANADTLGGFNTGYSTPFQADSCATYTDWISCSTPLLNFFAGLDPTTRFAQGGFVIASAQGNLQNQTVIVGSGSGTFTGDNANFLAATNQNGFTGVGVNDPWDLPGGTGAAKFFTSSQGANEKLFYNESGTSGQFPFGSPYNTGFSYDIGLGDVLSDLTFDGQLHDLLIGFDHNQDGTTTGQDLEIWAQVCVRDADGALPTICFVLSDAASTGNTATRPGFVNPDNAGGTLLPSMINSYDFVPVFGDLCVQGTPGNTNGDFQPWTGSCPSGYTHISNNLGTENAEFVAYVPQLNLQMLSLYQQGYDTLSAQIMYGCFGDGAGYGPALKDGVNTNLCITDGFEDIFLLAGSPRQTQVPEPGTPLLIGVGLAGLWWAARRRKLA